MGISSQAILAFRPVVFTVLGVAVAGLSQAAHADWTLKFAHTAPSADTTNLAAEQFAKNVEERTQGEISVRVFPNGQLGSDQAIVSGVRAGMIDLAVIGNPYFTGLIEDLNVLDLPFLFDSREQAYTILDGEVGRQLLDKMEPQQLKGLAFWEIGFRNITNSRRPVESAEDIAGLKLRTTPNPAHLEAFASLGANPVPMPFTELFTALETGTVDGQENPVTLIRSSNLYEVQDHLSLTEHAYTAEPFVMNLGTFNELPAEYQQIVVDEAKKAAAYERQLNNERQAEDLAYLKEQGMAVVSDPDRESMRRMVGKPVRDWFIEKHGSQWLNAIEQAK
ncbi:TRAP transporter substrate-binding protein [Halomonas sp. McH1-25]|uniref:TRAP transporter substrate-binding protein n=1 Tax=unclassified Halomonas TaxID=2609666 RepID=UPI001EF59F5C|nr:MULTISPECIES: TRAP transporter substrate-binding protein [unclassified Halomonas]MCG7601098.1 TRAP transporter substrate-binding protein [Halomonas sp. McH1-25]MCP1342968.1 TRAP transporter substrate-binding protein [Halomonas sp. FL8]MCP1360820.1 TRAP transporter substrate-binding protein [Halomonas sp. BBD45]